VAFSQHVGQRKASVGCARDVPTVEIARRDDVPISVIGEVRGHRLEIGDLIGVDVATLRDCWRNGLTKALAGSLNV